MNPSGRLELREAAVIGGNHDITGQGQLDTEGIGDTLNSRNNRFFSGQISEFRVFNPIISLNLAVFLPYHPYQDEPWGGFSA